MKHGKHFIAHHAFTLSRLGAALILMSGLSTSAVAVAAPALGDSAAWATTHTHAANMASTSFQGYAADQEPVSITVALTLRNKNLLDSFTHELFRSGSPTYHQWMTSEQTTSNFAPTLQQAQAVAGYLTKSGFTNVQIAPNRLLVTADGTVGAARQAFRTTIGHFTRNGHSGIANVSDVQVPAALAVQVDRVLGLQTLVPIRTFSRHEFVPAYTVVGVSGNSSAHLYYPQEFATAYDAGSTPTASQTTVALIGWGSMTNAVNDLNQFESAKGITPVPTSVVSTSTQSSSDDNEQGEWGLDAQAIVGVAGNVRQLIFYTDGGTYDPTTGSSGDIDSSLLQVINRAVSDNIAKVINMSWGRAECDGQSSVGFADSVLQVGVAQGQTFSAASGDHGSYPCAVNGQAPPNGSYSSSTQLSVAYPASSPYVIAIGGTTLNTTVNDSYISESSWAYGGGGISAYESLPDWQNGLGPSHRQVPDLAFDADWTNSPIGIYLTASATSGVSQSGWYTNGGTSLASPLFVGSWARLETANNNGLGFAAPSIYTYSNSIPFHDVRTGTNGYYSATIGRDGASGWGSFDIAEFNSFIQSTPGFGSALTPPTVAITRSAEAYVFWEGTDNNLWQALGGAAGPLNGPQNHDVGALGSAPSVGVDGSGATYVYWEGGDKNLWESYWNGSAWVGPYNRGMGPLNSSPTVAITSNATAYVFWKGEDGNLWEAPGSAAGPLSGPQNRGMGPLGSAPSVGMDGNGATYVYWEGADRNLWEAYWNGSRWVGPFNRGMGPLNSPPAVAITSNGTAYVFWRGTDNNLWEVSGSASGSLSGLQNLGMGPLGSAPAAGVDGNGATYVYWEGTGKSLWEAYWNGSAWTGPINRGMTR